MNWDWYSATVSAGPDEVLGTLCAELGAAESVPCRGLYSYIHGAEVHKAGQVTARAYWGGINGEDSVHVQASGADTPEVVGVVRSVWPDHRVSRADSREDWSHPKAWRWLSKAAIGVARQMEVATSTVGDWLNARAGRTLYVGGQASRVRVRVYEKGKQLGTDPDWVRLEIQVRPSGVGKSNLATVLPGQLMEVSPWTQQLARVVGAPELEAVRIRDPWTPSDDDRALHFCLRQYGPLFERKASSLGGWSELGKFLGAERSRVLRGRH